MKQVTIDELRDFAYVLSTSFLFHVLLIIIFLDILTGYAKAIKTKSLNSKIGTNGIIRHIKDIIEAIPEWIQGQEYQRNTYVRFNGVVYKTIHPIGFYEIGKRAYYQGKLYEVISGNGAGINTWKPDEYGWKVVE